MRNKKNKAYTLLTVLFVTAFLSSFILAEWRMASINSKLVYEREIYYKKIILARCYMRQAIKWTQRNFDNISFSKQHQRKIMPIYTESLLSNDLMPVAYIESYSLPRSTKTIIINLSLYEKEKLVCEIACLLSRSKAITKKESHFVVDGFTIGPFI